MNKNTRISIHLIPKLTFIIPAGLTSDVLSLAKETRKGKVSPWLCEACTFVAPFLFVFTTLLF